MTAAGGSAIEVLLKRERLFVLVGLLGTAASAWLYLVLIGVHSHMAMGDGLAGAQIRQWSLLDFVLTFVMWQVMMIGMMVPSATPMVLLFAGFWRRQGNSDRLLTPLTAFVAGYLAVWTAFSLGATLAQWGLEQAALMSPAMTAATPAFGAALLIGAGFYQLTPLKRACLKGCRSPVQFLMTRWQVGGGGALRMGIEHGALCVGCCWLLMGLLFVGGVMNLLWVAAIALLVLAEKLVSFGETLGRIGGAGLIGAGLWLLA